MYVVNVGHGDFLCTGSYVVHGEKYQIIGDVVKARRFKTWDAAKKWATYLQGVRANVNEYTIIDLMKSEGSR
nr:MAG TPA: hypothetical protein [Caudoviricetes sp.]